MLNHSLSYAQNVEKDDLINKPSIVIGIIIDQMQPDYIDRYWEMLIDDGFKRLVNEYLSSQYETLHPADKYTASIGDINPYKRLP